MNRVLVCCLFLAVSFTSCDPLRYFEENKEIPKMEWDKDEPLSFLVSVEDTSLGYNVFINVRNAGFYRFSNLYLFINTTFPQGQVHRDTIECILASPEGRWLGEGLGDIWDNRILFKENVQFTQPGEYRFELNQAMRINPLPGIMDAGIRIEKVDK
ncbi:MAG: gliding motility lipoprotein GldH [Bacteroidetes bacterium]|nr:gliding motility lipoprotein GldH [Bacteroidota bacterium]MBL0073790.1 gliding motility lipoprotein GldH [Bacteroidota bacterium]